MDMWKFVARFGALVLVLATLVACSDDDGNRIIIDDDSNAAPSENHDANSQFALQEFVYQSGPRELSVVEVQGMHSEDPQINRRVFYEHFYDIHSFQILRDRSGIVITADHPDPDFRAYHTYGAYFVDASGDGPYELIKPIEVDSEVASLRVEESVGGLEDRIWFGLHHSTLDHNGNLTATTVPMSLDGASSLQTYPASCTLPSNIRAHTDGQHVAMIERFCGTGLGGHYVTVYGTPDLGERHVVAENGQAGLSLHLANGLEWVTNAQLLVADAHGQMIVVDVTGEEAPFTLLDARFDAFTLAPDQSAFLGRVGSQLQIFSLENPVKISVLVDDSENQTPSW